MCSTFNHLKQIAHFADDIKDRSQGTDIRNKGICLVARFLLFQQVDVIATISAESCLDHMVRKTDSFSPFETILIAGLAVFSTRGMVLPHFQTGKP